MADDLTNELGQNIPLYEMIQTLRAELQASMEAAKDESLQFTLQDVELELRVVVSRGKNTTGKLGFWVIGAEVQADVDQRTAHIFKIKLRPRTTYDATIGEPAFG